MVSSKSLKKSISMSVKKSIKKNNSKVKVKSKKIKIKIKKEKENSKSLFKIGDKVIIKNKDYAKIMKVNKNSVNVKYTDKAAIEQHGNKNFSFNIKDIKKCHNKKNGNSILLPAKSRLQLSKNTKKEPLYWVMPHEKEFPEWINATFLKYRMSGVNNNIKSSKSTKKEFKPFLYQNFLRDYLSIDSPYRGILLYHGLGSGKTCTAIHIAESLKTDLNIIVMLPASLKNNFIEDGLKFCGDDKYKNNDDLIKSKYSFISYNASNVAKQIQDIGTLDNHVIIIDEVHNLLSVIVNGLLGNSKNGKFIYKSLMDAKNCKIIALTGTPVVNIAFELAVLFNILRGYIEITLFRVVDHTIEKDFNYLEEKIMNIDNVDYVKYNRGNKTFEVHLMVNSWTDEYKDTLEEIETAVLKEDKLSIKYFPQKTGAQLFTAFPDEIESAEPKRFNQYFIKEVEGKEYLINHNLFHRRIMGLVSYYNVQRKDYPDVKMNDFIKIPMSDYQFAEYNFVREIEKKAEKQGAKQSKKDKSKKSSSYFRVLSRQFSNFVFPKEIDRPWPNERLMIKLKHVKNNKNEMNKDEMNKLLKDLDETDQKVDTKKFKKKLDDALNKLSEGDFLNNTNTGLGTYSPKMKIMFENINKATGLVFCYSNFRSVEGVEIFTRILNKNGYRQYDSKNAKANSKYDFKQYAIYSGVEDYAERKKIVQVFNNPLNNYGKNIKIILATSAGAEGLDLHNIRQIHIMEPYWNEVKMEQVVGRGVRRNSHVDLPLNERNVEVFRYISVFKKDHTIKAIDKDTTDEHILELAVKKQLLTNELLDIIKKSSVDCWLNKEEIKGDYECFSFGKGAKGIASVPDIMQDRILDTSHNTKIKKTKLVIGRIDTKDFILIPDNKLKTYFNVIDILKKNPIIPVKGMFVKKVAINIREKKVYDFKDAKSLNPPIIGHFNKNGRFVEKS
jgi:superfamily II DNA or RNA helicase